MTDPKVLLRAKNIIANHSLNPSLQMITSRHSDDPNIELWKIKSLGVASFSTISHDIQRAVWECSCKFYQFRGECKHIVTIKICRENGIIILPNEEDNDNGI